MNVGDNSYYLQSKNYGTTDSDGKILGTFFDLQSGKITTNSIIVNRGTFKGDVIINYNGGTGDGHWADGDQSLTYILNKIATAASSASTAAETAKGAAYEAAGAISALNSFFNIGMTVDQKTGIVKWGKRIEMTPPKDNTWDEFGSIAVGTGISMKGDFINIGNTGGTSSINFHSSTIWMNDSETIDNYILRVVKTKYPSIGS